MTQQQSVVKRITISAERTELEPFARHFCDAMLPGVAINTLDLEPFAELLHQDYDPEELFLVILQADEQGHLQNGSPIVQHLMTSQVPVMVLRQHEWLEQPQTSFNRIVVPLDGSSTAGQAVPVASRLAGISKLPVKFVMVIDPSRVIPPAYTYDPEAWGVIEELRLTAHWALGQAEAMMKRDGVESSSDLLLGSINASLMASIGEGDLVVMTTHGLDRHNLRHQDSVAMRVLCSIPQPILIMQAQPQQSVVVDGYQACGWAEPLAHDASRIA